MDLRILHVVKNLGSGILVLVILAKTLRPSMVWMTSLLEVLSFFKYDP